MIKSPNQYLKGNCYINHSCRYVYFAMTKVASTTMKKRLALPDDGLIYEEELAKRPYIESYFKFAIIRDPLERFISAYTYMSTDQYIRARVRNNIKCYPTHLRLRYFESFLKKLTGNPLFDVHMYPQHYFLSNKEDELYPINYFIPLKKLDKYWHRIEPVVKVSLHRKPDRAFNKSDRISREKVRGWISGSRKELIKKLYKKDWELYESSIC